MCGGGDGGSGGRESQWRRGRRVEWELLVGDAVKDHRKKNRVYSFIKTLENSVDRSKYNWYHVSPLEKCPTNKLFQIKLDEDKLYIAIVEPDEIQNFVVYDFLCKII